MSNAENPRAVAGSNEAPDYAQMVTDQMRADYEEVETTVAGLLDEARALPGEVVDDAAMGVFARLIKRMRDTTARIEAYRMKEKEPYLRGGNAVDGFFGALATKIARKARTDKPGAADILQARLDSYNQRKLVEEQERRRKVAAEEARIAAERRAEQDRAWQAAEAARLAAERARKPENVTAKAAVADAREAEASAAGVEAVLAAGRAEDAHVATLARPADLVRTRVDDALVTMGTEPYAEIVDAALLDKETLWPFISEDAKAKALRAWAKTTGHRTQMAGASIGKRPKSVVR